MQRPQFMNFGTILESQEVERQVLPDRLPDSDSIWSRQDDGTAKTLSDGESEGHQVDKTLMEIEEELEKEQELAMEIEKDMEKQFENDMEKAKQESMELEKQREKEKAMEMEKELEKQRENEKAMELKKLEKQREKEKAMEMEKELEQREKAMELKKLENQREKEKAMEMEKELEKQREKEKAMELKKLEKQREKEKAMEMEKELEKQREKAMELKKLEKQREKEKAMELEKELEKQREKEKAMELEKELAEEMEKQFEHDMEVAKQASMEVEVEKKQQLMICDFPVKRSFQEERFNKLYRAIHGRILKMDAVETPKAKKQMQIHPKFLEFLMHFDCPYDEVDLMASWDLWCEHNGVVKVDEPIPPTVERHTTKENINKFFDPKTYKATEGDGLPTPEKPAEHGGGPGAELPPKSESVEDEKFALLTAADQRRLRTSRKDENAEKKTRHTKKGPPKSSASAVPAEKEKKRPVEVEEQEQEEPKENDNKRRKSAQLVDKDRQEEFKKNLKLSFNQVFCLGKAYVFFWGGRNCFCGLKPIAALFIAGW